MNADRFHPETAGENRFCPPFFEEQGGGYRKDQVDRYIAQITEEYRRVCSQCAQAEQNNEMIWKTFFKADILSKQILDDARKKAERVLAEAARPIVSAPDPEQKPAPMPAPDPEPMPVPKPGRIRRALSGALFYAVILSIVAAAFFYTRQNNRPNGLFGYSHYNVLTGSMQSVMPSGSLILVKSVRPETLQIGDDITFLQGENIVVTHRVIDVIPDFEGSGQPGFRTKGTDNAEPDRQIAYAGNVVGKVIWHVPVLGAVLEYAGANIWRILILIALAALLILCVHSLTAKKSRRELYPG